MADEWTCPADRFPVMGPGYPRYGERRLTVPIAIVLRHEKQAQANHGQTVTRLKERGGLAWCELLAVLEDRDWTRVPLDLAHERCMRIILAEPSDA